MQSWRAVLELMLEYKPLTDAQWKRQNPEEAASRIEKLEEDMAVMILASMSERKAAKVLSFVNVSKSAKLSQSLIVKN